MELSPVLEPVVGTPRRDPLKPSRLSNEPGAVQRPRARAAFSPGRPLADEVKFELS
jgi:hypothetical protein